MARARAWASYKGPPVSATLTRAILARVLGMGSWNTAFLKGNSTAMVLLNLKTIVVTYWLLKKIRIKEKNELVQLSSKMLKLKARDKPHCSIKLWLGSARATKTQSIFIRVLNFGLRASSTRLHPYRKMNFIIYNSSCSTIMFN